MKLARIAVKSSAGNYAVVCGSGALSRLAGEISSIGTWSGVHVVSSRKVWRVLGRKVLRALGSLAPRVHLIDDAESAKNLRTVEGILRRLVRARADRKSLLVAVGGGVVGDVAGFAAASYLRGVSLVQAPTTLVALVDSAVGGKTGVNLPEGKNLAGAFHPPVLVIADSDVLRTLPDREFRGGLAEVVKYGVIADPALFAFLEKNIGRVLRRDTSALEYLIRRSVEIKARVVGRDEHESGLREILNFGHTFGHALESVTRYRRFQHGEAVSWGMMAAALLGHEMGLTPARDASRIVSLVRCLGPFPPWPALPPGRLVAAMRSDKKARAGKLRFVLASRIGKAGSFDTVPLQVLDRVLRFAPRLASGGHPPHG